MNSSLEYNLSYMYHFNLSETIQYYFVIIVAPIGICMNFLSLLIFFRKTFHQQTTIGVYNICIAISNMITIFYYILVQESSTTLKMNLLIQSDFSCKIGMLFRRVIRELTPLIECLLTIDRFLDVYFMGKFKRIKKTPYILLLILVSFIVFLIISIENLLYNLKETRSPSSNTTIKTCSASKEIASAADIISSILRTYLPISVMIIFNVLIIIRLREGKFKMKTKSNKDSKFTFIVMCLNGCFLLFNLPISIAYIIRNVYLNYFNSPNSFFLIYINFYFDMFYVLATAYYMSNFFLNFALNKIFRQEIWIILGMNFKQILYFLS